MKPIGVVASGSSAAIAPIQVYKQCELDAKEEAFVVVKDEAKNLNYLGVLRNLRMQDPLLSPNLRSSVVDNPGLARMGREVVFETSAVRIIGVLREDGSLEPSTQPPTPRSEVYLVESPSDVNLKLEKGLVVGSHKYSGIEIPLSPKSLPYHIGIVGATGTGKSRLAIALIKEVLANTDWKVLVFDHSGLDYKPYFPDKAVSADEVLPDVEDIYNHLANIVKEREEDAYLFYTLIAYIVAGGDPGAVKSRLQSEVRQFGRREGGTDEGGLEGIISEFLSTNPEEALKHVNWDLAKFGEVLSSVAKALGAKKTTPAKYRVKLASKARGFFESLKRRRLSVGELLGRLDKERVLVVDLSTVDYEERASILNAVLGRLWDRIDETKTPVNTLVVVDEAHNYACRECGSVDIIERTAREGRKWGLGLVLVSQRVVDFSTWVRNNINTYFFSRLQTPGDLQNLQGDLDLGGITQENIALLREREFYFAGLGNPLRHPVLIKVKTV
ncbi:putative ATPase [Thermogladius calderae 1633]|uniref:Putative ATPase n=1 Tax=Thermogladius calderae (strain DSM 22663 / VKM B-2946 / 1633) TaxID=1184251 RepID=I3TFU0_THEC1|nr:ATP-binding protein [Thermogladius calderae]AFK51628.1 putative ATPase [Thermogladius calderae 1633]